MMRALLWAVLLMVVAPQVQAHPLAPALLELRQQAEGHYEVLFRTSVIRARGSEVWPEWPVGCSAQALGEPETEDGEALLLRWRLDCAEGLEGRSLGVRGLDRAGINVILRIERGRDVTQALLDAGQPFLTVPAPGVASPVFSRYLGLGVEHLLLGPDHLLFVLGLMLLVRGLPALLLTITAFTLGHSLTLALAVLDVIRVPQAWAELGIAFSLVMLALAALRPADAPRALLARRPWAMAAGFGLLHGLGFAGALAEVGLPPGEVPLALLAFNLGIELGQVLLVVVVLALAALWRRAGQRTTPTWARLMPAYPIGSLAVYWCLDRAMDVL